MNKPCMQKTPLENRFKPFAAERAGGWEAGKTVVSYYVSFNVEPYEVLLITKEW